MHKLAFALLFVGSALSGCLGDEETESSNSNVVTENPMPPEDGAGAILITEYFQDMLYGADVYVPDDICGTSPFPDPAPGFPGKFYMGRIYGRNITDNHTSLVIDFQIDNLFSDTGLSGHRVGAYYNHELMFWTESFMESGNFTYQLDGDLVDTSNDERWTFFYKRTDLVTNDNEDGCTSGQQSGSILIEIYAK